MSTRMTAGMVVGIVTAALSAGVVLGQEVQVFSNSNSDAVHNICMVEYGDVIVKKPVLFALGNPHVITAIRTYHWNQGQGATPGTISLAEAMTGRKIGEWQAVGIPGSGGRPNAYWEVRPNVLLPAGSFLVDDSDHLTWSCNEKTGVYGITWVMGVPAGGVADPGPDATPTPAGCASHEWVYQGKGYFRCKFCGLGTSNPNPDATPTPSCTNHEWVYQGKGYFRCKFCGLGTSNPG